MLLEQSAHYNDLSPELRDKLVKRVEGFGKTVRYKFNISHQNPDPLKQDGETVWPFLYTLDPTTFRITDPHEKREGKQRMKVIGLIEKTDEKGIPNVFRKIRVRERHKGILELNLEDHEEFHMAIFLELHPKHDKGLFPDKTKQQVFSRIDENELADAKREERKARTKALNKAEGLSDAEVIQFVRAMMWNEGEDLKVLRNKVETLAETDHDIFNKLFEGDGIEYQATIKQAIDKKVIGFDPAEYKLIWSSNQQTIAKIQPNIGLNELENFAEYFKTGGKNAESAYKQIKALIK